ncbi:Export ABC transporter permease protein [uncultured Desulfatiglans sp.]|uniref:Export ABC transporter permease protein n=1 Tax=Uncultured Desulfatiglans sp. TaxID=1748965 RepID=A0A653A718_UNCDX|nr:Export ABC transporter permease protein [uncultured Desulfatiglans sp.]
MRPAAARAIARKEYYHLIRDFRSLYLAFAIPLLLILIFGYALSLDVENVRTMVVDYDRTPLSRDLIQRLDATVAFRVVAHLPRSEDLAAELDAGRTTLGIVIPPGWSAELRADRQAPLQVLIDGSDPNFAGITKSYAEAFIQGYNLARLQAFLDRSGMGPIDIPVEGRVRVWFNEDLESRNFIVPGIIAIIIMIVGAMLTSLVIAKEYEDGTMETIRSLPVTALEFLIGKAVPYFFIALVDVLIAVLMGQVLFGVVMKSSFWLMILASAVYLCVALSLGFLISILTKSQLVANQLAVLVTYLPSLLLSDFVFPVVNMPPLLQKVTAIVPATYFIDIMNGLYLRELGLAHLWTSYAVLLGMFAALGIGTLLALKREGL